MIFRFFSLLLSAMLLMLSGCTWFRDNRPEPSGLPYAADSRQPKHSYTEAEAVNAAVSAISLRMATAARGPYRVVPGGKEVSPLGYQVIDSLTRMRLSRISAPSILQLEDARTDPDGWNFTLRNSDGTVFITKTFQLKEGSHAGQ